MTKLLFPVMSESGSPQSRSVCGWIEPSGMERSMTCSALMSAPTSAEDSQGPGAHPTNWLPSIPGSPAAPWYSFITSQSPER